MQLWWDLKKNIKNKHLPQTFEYPLINDNLMLCLLGILYHI